MNSRKKLVATAISLVAVALVAVASISLVFAAINITTTSTFTVTYTANNVSVNMSAAYTVLEDNTKTITLTDESLASEQNITTNGNLTMEQATITFPTSSAVVVVRFKITNNATDKKINATLTNLSDASENFDRYCLITDSASATYEQIKAGIDGKSSAIGSPMNASAVKYLYLMYEIKDGKKDSTEALSLSESVEFNFDGDIAQS